MVRNIWDALSTKKADVAEKKKVQKQEEAAAAEKKKIQKQVEAAAEKTVRLNQETSASSSATKHITKKPSGYVSSASGKNTAADRDSIPPVPTARGTTYYKQGRVNTNFEKHTFRVFPNPNSPVDKKITWKDTVPSKDEWKKAMNLIEAFNAESV